MKAKTIFLFCCALLLINSTARAAIVFDDDIADGSGLSGHVKMEFFAPTTLVITARNTSTGFPVLNNSGDPFEVSDQLLTGVSWDFGEIGFNGDANITGGSVVIGPDSNSSNFDTGDYPAGFNVSGEYGYGNKDGTGALTNFVSGNGAQATPFGGANLDGPISIDGPQGGLVADPALITLSGLGAIQNEFIATLTLFHTKVIDVAHILGDLGIVRIEFGSDAHFIDSPEPTSFVLAFLALVSLSAVRRRRRS